MQCESLKIIKPNCHFNFRISLPLLCTTQIHLARKKVLYIYIFIYLYTSADLHRAKNRLYKMEHPWSYGQYGAGHWEKVTPWGFCSHLLFPSQLLAVFPGAKVWIQRSEWVISINLVPHVCSIARQQVAARHPHPAISFWWLRLLLY